MILQEVASVGSNTRHVGMANYIYLESQSTSENGYKYLSLRGHVPFSKVLWRVQVYIYIYINRVLFPLSKEFFWIKPDFNMSRGSC